MYPEIFRYGDFVISSFGLMMVVAFITCNYILRKDLVKYGYDFTIADDIIFRAAIGGIIGAKLYYILESGGAENLEGIYNIFYGAMTLSWETFYHRGIMVFGSGLVFLGGLIGGLFSVTHYLKKKSLDWFEFVDYVAPLLALGHSIGRIGCLLVGDDYGRPTDLPWAISFGNGLPPSTVENITNMGYEFANRLSPNMVCSVHPTQIYECVLYFIIFLYLRYLFKHKDFDGEIFFNYLFLVGLSRFLVEFLRLNPRYYFDLSGAQYVSLVMILVASIFFYKHRQKKV